MDQEQQGSPKTMKLRVRFKDGRSEEKNVRGYGELEHELAQLPVDCQVAVGNIIAGSSGKKVIAWSKGSPAAVRAILPSVENLAGNIAAFEGHVEVSFSCEESKTDQGTKSVLVATAMGVLPK